MAPIGGEIIFYLDGAEYYNSGYDAEVMVQSSSIQDPSKEGYVFKGWRVTRWGASTTINFKDGTYKGYDDLDNLLVDNNTVDYYYTGDGGLYLSAEFEESTPANPTISQLHIDGVTYDLRDRNAGEGVTTEEKAKLAALPEAAEIPSDIGPKSEVVEEAPAEYVAGKVYFVVDVEPKYKDETELIALGSADAILSELNRDAEGYYNFINAVTPEGLCNYYSFIYNGRGGRFFPYSKSGYNCYKYSNGVWEFYDEGGPS